MTKPLSELIFGIKYGTSRDERGSAAAETAEDGRRRFGCSPR